MADPFEISDDDRTELVSKAYRMAMDAGDRARDHFAEAKKLEGEKAERKAGLGGWELKKARQFREYARVLTDTNPRFLPDEKRAAMGVVRRHA